MLNVVARVEDPYGRHGNKHERALSVGLFVEAEILGRSANNVFIVPRAALRGRNTVKLVDEESRLRLRQVTILRMENDHAVISDGLKAGEWACISPLDTPVDGMLVRTESKTASKE